MHPYGSTSPSLAQQATRLRIAQPKSRVHFDHCGNRMVWTGRLQPSAVSEAYTTRIVYTRQQRQPRIFVVAPQLAERNGEAIPHTYGDGGLCLWQPAYHEWQPRYWIADTIIGWASLWLFFYELWHACGEWLGGGEHPGDNADDEMENASERH